MAKTLKELTRVGTDARKIARLLQGKAPPGHMLAFINEREAALLKAAGGSGHIDPQTGIRSFEDEMDYLSPTPPTPPADFGPPPDFAEAPSYSLAGFQGAPTDFTAAAQQYYSPGDVGALPQLASFPTPTAAPELGFARSESAIRDLIEQQTRPEAPAAPAAPKGAGLNLGQLGVTGLGALLGARQAKKTTAAAQAGAQEMRQLAAPYQQAGQQLQAAAQRGELTPGSQQALQAMQAQLAQGAEARGGVGVAQAQAAIANLRNQLLQQQYDYGLKLSGIGDNIALGAIRTGLEADKYAAQLSQNFYSNLARLAGGAFSPGR